MDRSARLAFLATAMLLAACGGSRQVAQPAAPASATPGDPAVEAPEAGAPAPISAAAPVAATQVKPPADTPMCRQFREVVQAAAAHFAPFTSETATPLPGATSCTVVGGDGPGQTTVTTYTCEYESAPDGAALSPKRDALEERLRECGSARALENTRVRIARAGDTSVLVINVHDSVRW